MQKVAKWTWIQLRRKHWRVAERKTKVESHAEAILTVRPSEICFSCLLLTNFLTAQILVLGIKSNLIIIVTPHPPPPVYALLWITSLHSQRSQHSHACSPPCLKCTRVHVPNAKMLISDKLIYLMTHKMHLPSGAIRVFFHGPVFDKPQLPAETSQLSVY